MYFASFSIFRAPKLEKFQFYQKALQNWSIFRNSMIASNR